MSFLINLLERLVQSMSQQKPGKEFSESSETQMNNVDRNQTDTPPEQALSDTDLGSAPDRKVDTASEWYSERMNFGAEDAHSHMAGTDFEKEVNIDQVVTGTLLAQYQTKEAIAAGQTGSYFAPLDDRLDRKKLGIENESPETQNRELQIYEAIENFEALNTTAKDIQAWDDSSHVYSGGGQQLCINEAESKVRLAFPAHVLYPVPVNNPEVTNSGETNMSMTIDPEQEKQKNSPANNLGINPAADGTDGGSETGGFKPPDPPPTLPNLTQEEKEAIWKENRPDTPNPFQHPFQPNDTNNDLDSDSTDVADPSPVNNLGEDFTYIPDPSPVNNLGEDFTYIPDPSPENDLGINVSDTPDSSMDTSVDSQFESNNLDKEGL